MRRVLKGFTMLGIALDEASIAEVKTFVQRVGVNYPVMMGTDQVAAAYGGIQALPTAFLVGRDGKILKTYVGAREKSDFQRDIETPLSQAGNESKRLKARP